MKIILTLLLLTFLSSITYSQCTIDTIPPTTNCTNITVQLSTTGIVIISANQIDSGSFDNCGIASLLINGQAIDTFNCSNLGTNPVVLVAIDSSGNSSTCTSIITIQDNIPPSVICQNATVYLNNSGFASVTPNQINGGSTDNCTIASLLVNGQASQNFTCADIGTTTTTLTVTDLSGNTNSCVATITIADTIEPVLNCSNVNVSLSNSGLAVILPNQINSSSFDNCNIITYLINGQAVDTFDCTNVGIPTPALLTAIDASGNQSTCTSTITIQDNTPPIALCQNINVYLNNSGVVNVTATQIDSGSTDNCGILSFLINGQAADFYDCSNVGINNALLTVTDISGNTSNCAANINVFDSINPIASCRNITVSLNNSGLATVSANQIDSNSVDNCSILSFLINGQASVDFDCNDLGNNTTVLSVTDIYGNIDTCSSIVTVTDPSSRCGLSSTLINAKEQNIHISPNPVQDILSINSEESFLQQITLSNITGQVIFNQQYSSQMTAHVDLSELPNAVYLLTVMTEKGSFTQKVIKN